MHKLRWLMYTALLAGATSAVYGDMAGIEILSEQYRAWGSVSTPYYPSWSDYDYDIAGSSPVSGSLGPLWSLIPPAPVVSAHATSSADPLDLFMLADANSFAVTHAGAEYSATFRPQASSLQIRLDALGPPGYLEGALGVSLIDVTASTPLLEVTRSMTEAVNLGVLVDSTFAVDTTHEYTIQMWGLNSSWGESNNLIRFFGTAVAIPAIPAPASAALGLIGLGMVGWLKRRSA